MLNVQTFQNMYENFLQQNAISKTSNLNFGQNYKKIIATSKASIDFKKSLFKSNLAKPPSIPDDIKRIPLGQINQNILTNNIFQAKSFKIRTYNKRSKQNDNEFVISINKDLRSRVKSIDIKQKSLKQFLCKKKTKGKQKQKQQTIKMQQFNNFGVLQCIAKNIKIYYNPDWNMTSQQVLVNEKAFILSISYLVHTYKTINKSQFQTRQQTLMKIIKDLISIFEQKIDEENQIKIMFKVKNIHELQQLRQICDQQDFRHYYCIFYSQETFVECYTVYNLQKIEGLSKKIILFDDRQAFSMNFPLIDETHLISFVCLEQKHHSSSFLQNLLVNTSFKSVDLKNINKQYVSQKSIILLPQNQLKQKIKLKYFRKNMKRVTRQKRCKSSYQQERPNISSLGKMEEFKQKMLKYIKIIEQEKKLGVIRSNSQKINQIPQQCASSRGPSKQQSKTNYQIIAQLIKLNTGVHKQIQNYNKQTNGLDFDMQQGTCANEWLKQFELTLNCPIIYVHQLN